MDADAICLHLRSGRVAFVRTKVLSAVVIARRLGEAPTARSVDGRAAVLRREAMIANLGDYAPGMLGGEGRFRRARSGYISRNARGVM